MNRRLLRGLACISTALFTLCLLAVPASRAQPAPSASAAPSASPALSSTAAPLSPPGTAAADQPTEKERFARGVALYKKGEWAPALAEFLEARKIRNSRQSTANAALCLKNLGRYDEALDMYAALLADFGDKLAPDARQEALQDVEQIRKLVGSIDISGSEPGAAVVIDRQDRGDYPLLSPLRVVAGNHIVRVYKEGFEPFETRLDVAGGSTAHVTARLRKLAVTGTLQVVEAGSRPTSVFVDGIEIGTTPLKTLLAPGKHVVFLRGEGTLGTVPATATVRADEVETLRLEAEPLDVVLRVEPVPFDALVSIDSVTVGRGLWEGRVRPGKHTIEAAAEGFLPESRAVSTEKGKREVVTLLLSRDSSSPFWRKPPPPPHFFAELAVGVPLVPSLQGSVVDGCSGDCKSPFGAGGSFVARAGYELSNGVSFGAEGGYLRALQVVEDHATSVTPIGKTTEPGTDRNALQLRGTLFGLWAGYSIGDTWALHLRLAAGGLLGAAVDVRTARFERTGTGETANAFGVGPFVQERDARYFFLAPEIRGGFRLREHVEIGIGLEVPVLFAVGVPEWSEKAITAGADGYATLPEATITGSVFAMILPSVGVRYDFH